MFGDNYTKKTCLWIKGLPLLIPKIKIPESLEYVEYIDKKGKKKRDPEWHYETFRLPKEERSKARSKTFPGIAKAMADQWG